jgi:hypothetical protein
VLKDKYTQYQIRKSQNYLKLCLCATETQAIFRGRPDFKLRKINLLSNKVAHSLAQLSKSECGVLDEAGPPCVAALLGRRLYELCVALINKAHRLLSKKSMKFVF